MSPRAELKAKRKAMKAALAQKRKDVKARLAKRPPRRGRSVLRILLVILVLVLLSLIRCECGPGPAPIPPSVVQVPKPAVKPPAPVPPKRTPLKGKLNAQPRARMEAPPSGLPDWLQAFRVQATARSPRLSECFKDAERPGALRWTGTVHPVDGTVSDAAVEPVGRGAVLSAAQLRCVLDAMARPAYVFKDRAAEATQVSWVLEF